MEDKGTKAQVSADPAKQRKYDYIPLNPQLITLVRSLSGLDVSIFNGVSYIH